MKATYEVTRAVLPDMVKQHYGRIVYIATGIDSFWDRQISHDNVYQIYSTGIQKR